MALRASSSSKRAQAVVELPMQMTVVLKQNARKSVCLLREKSVNISL